jgi:hypothetical protein
MVSHTRPIFHMNKSRDEIKRKGKGHEKNEMNETTLK